MKHNNTENALLCLSDTAFIYYIVDREIRTSKNGKALLCFRGNSHYKNAPLLAVDILLNVNRMTQRLHTANYCLTLSGRLKDGEGRRSEISYSWEVGWGKLSDTFGV
jgi:hypothetical protein